MRSPVVIALLCAFAFALLLGGLASPALAQDDNGDGDGDGQSPETAHDRVIYIPYDELDEALNQPDGVFLPYDEFEALWRRANEREVTPEPDVAAVVSRVRYEGQVDGDSAQFVATLSIRVFVEGWVAVPLPLGGVSLSDATIDGEQALLQTDGQGYRLLIERAPAGEQTYTLALTYEVPVTAAQNRTDWRQVSFQVPHAAVAQLSFTVDQPSLMFEVSPRLAVAVPGDSGDSSTTIETFLGNGNHVTIRWKTEVAREEQEAVVHAEQASRFSITEGVVTLATRFTLTAVQGTFDEVLVELPDAFTLRSPENPEWTSFEPVAGDTPDDKRLHIRLRQPSSSHVFELEFESTDVPEELSVPLCRLLGVNRESGYVAIGADELLDVRIVEANGVTQADTEKLPPYCTQGLVGAANARGYRFLEPGAVTLRAAVSLKQPVLKVWANHLLVLDEAQRMYRLGLRCTVEKTGIFALLVTLPDGYQLIDCGPIGSLVSGWPEEVADPDASEDQPARRVLRIPLVAMRMGTFDITLSLQRSLGATLAQQNENQPIAIDLPVARVLGCDQDRGHYGIALKDTLNGDTTELTNLNPLGVARFLTQGVALASEHPVAMAFQYITTKDEGVTDRTPIGGRVELSLKDAQVSCEVIHHVSITDEAIYRNTYVMYAINFAGVDTFRIRVEGAESEVKFDAEGLRQQPAPEDDPDNEGAKLYTLKTSDKRKGTWVVNLHWQDRIKSVKPNTQESLSFPRVTVLDVDNEFGTYLISKKSTIHLGNPTTENCTVIDTAEPEIQAAIERATALLATNLSLTGGAASPTPTLAFRYQGHPHTLSLVLVRREFLEQYAVVIQRLHLEVSVGEDFATHVDALVTFQMRNQQALIVTLPVGAANKRVRRGPRIIDLQEGATEQEIRIPLKSVDQDTSLTLSIAYDVPCVPEGLDASDPLNPPRFGLTGAFTLAPPDFGEAPINETTWRLTLPGRFEYRVDDPAYEVDDEGLVYVNWGTISDPSPQGTLADAAYLALSRRAGASPVTINYVSHTGRNFAWVAILLVTAAICFFLPLKIKALDPIAVCVTVLAIALVACASEPLRPFAEPAAIAAAVVLAIFIARSVLVGIGQGSIRLRPARALATWGDAGGAAGGDGDDNLPEPDSGGGTDSSSAGGRGRKGSDSSDKR